MDLNVDKKPDVRDIIVQGQKCGNLEKLRKRMRHVQLMIAGLQRQLEKMQSEYETRLSADRN